MSPENRSRIGALWIGIAQMYGKEISKQTMSLILNAIDDLEPEKIVKVLNDWTTYSKLGRHPYPAEIREKINPPMNARDIANDMARKIDKAVARHGYMWPSGISSLDGTYWEGGGTRHSSFKDAVIAELGDIGWHVICSRGGWLSVRNSSNDMEEGQFIAQMRDQIESTIKLKESGVDVSRIALPGSQSTGIEGSALSLVNIKTIEGDSK